MRAAPKRNLPLVKPQGNLGEVLSGEAGRQWKRWWRAPLPAKGSHHVKQPRECANGWRLWLPYMSCYVYDSIGISKSVLNIAPCSTDSFRSKGLE